MSQELVPLQDIEKMGQNVAESGLFGIKTKQQAVALMLVAQALGKHPALAAMEYNIIQGRPAKKAESILADFQASGGKIEWHQLEDVKVEATFSHPMGGSLKLSWDIDRAKKAGLYDKDGSMYKKYPRQMLRSRLIAEGVRAIYPAAMGGFKAIEEFDEPEHAEDVKIDKKKSRLENIIDAQAEPEREVIDAPKEVEVQEKPKKSTKETKEMVGNSLGSNSNKIIIGIIEEDPKTAEVTNPVNGIVEKKHSFKLGELRYGTFDQELAAQIMKVLELQKKMRKNDDNARIMVKIEYTERKSNDKIFNDIVKFGPAVAEKDVPI